jgi:aminoglycoside adenylyltransferase-like protein
MLLQDFLVRVQAILQDKLIGLYLCGSLSWGDFDPGSSDVDFLIVTTEELAGTVLDALHGIHASIAASENPYAQRVEGSYISHAALRRYDPDNARHPSIGVDWEFQVAEHGSHWIIERHIVRERGVIVWGPSPRTLIDPVSPHQLRAAVCVALEHFWQKKVSGPEPEWLRPRDYQAFAALTMCRALFTLSRGQIVSKPRAATWALQTLDPRWRVLIERALIWRHQHDKDDLTETLEFVRFALTVGRALCEQ